ncbi:MAG: hypothetical protein MZV64_09455 [Ignavibacteriales bacterium]|nr:hypothetical protein [Ignavibacteriales bacterium]
MAHMDTASDVTAKDVKPRIVKELRREGPETLGRAIPWIPPPTRTWPTTSATP